MNGQMDGWMGGWENGLINRWNFVDVYIHACGHFVKSLLKRSYSEHDPYKASLESHTSVAERPVEFSLWLFMLRRREDPSDIWSLLDAKR